MLLLQHTIFYSTSWIQFETIASIVICFGEFLICLFIISRLCVLQSVELEKNQIQKAKRLYNANVDLTGELL